jgi:NADPH:quinone reductase-like Zn-dependent oxidoreductase
MRAAVYEKFGGPDVVGIADVPRPVIKPDEVLIRVEASTVSIADYRTRTKDLPPGLGFFGPLALGAFRPRHPILGMDLSGTIDEVGSAVTRFSPGDRVIALRGSSFGAHAEYAAMPANGAIALAPTNLRLDDAAALVFGGTTMKNFFNLASPSGLRVLVNGASGATGTAAVQLARAMGASSVTGVSSAANHELVASLGATDLIDYATTDFTKLDRQWDVIVDCVGNAGFSRVSESVTPGGAVLLVVGSLASMLTAGRDSKRLGGVVAMMTKSATASDLEFLVELAEAGAFVPTVDRRYTLDEIVEAHRYVGLNRKKGALLISIR